MASRAFSFDIPKPATGVDTTALQQNLFFDLRDKYPAESGVDSIKFIQILSQKCILPDLVIER